MAESTLALQFNDLTGEVGSYLGWGRGALNGDAAFTTQQQSRIDSIVKSGISRVLWPDPVQGQSVGYSWSFMHPSSLLTLSINQPEIPFPDDFGGVEGELYLTGSANRTWLPIKWYNEGMLDEAYSRLPNLSSLPQMAAVRWLKGTTGTQGQRANLYIFPLPDQNYIVRVQYYVNPDYLTATFPYTPGGAQHSELFKESCLAAAEQLLDDMPGVHTQRFNVRLMASISMDQKNKAISLGYNADRSDGWDWRDYRWNHGLSPITFNGVQPG